jgi:uncharacterized protein (TIGR00299 family) protein
MRVLWLDCGSGASGDMLLGALLGAGASLDAVRAAVEAVATAGAEPVHVSVEPAVRGALAATRVRIELPPDAAPRTWSHVRELLETAALPDAVRALALDVFGRLAGAEAQVHSIAPDDVHFHEVGALDAIADVVGTSTALLSLDVEEVVASPVALGSGTVDAAHGSLPVPAPATLALLADVGAPVESGGQPYEMCTPTGAALLAATVTRWGGLPLGRVVATGHGAGAGDRPGRPNVVRAVVLEPTAEMTSPTTSTSPSTDVDEGGGAVLVATNVDDLDPRLWPAVLSRLVAVGASDAWLTPILMKKGRPAHTLSVLCTPEVAAAVRTVIFQETSAIGVREQQVVKHALDRTFVEVRVAGHVVRVKLASLDGAVVNSQPEYDDVAVVAEATGLPAKQILVEASAAALGVLGSRSADTEQQPDPGS